MRRAQAAKRPVALVTDLATGLQTLVWDDAVHGGFGLEDEALAVARRHLAEDRSALVEVGADQRLFIRAYNPPLRLIVVGAVHIAQALAPMASLAGYDVTVVDPRRAFATDERFPGVTVIREWPDDAMSKLVPDSRTAVVTLTHDPKLDDPALIAAVASPAFYIGALGSSRTHAKRLDRLRAAGVDDKALARVHGPVGLDIGAVSPAEIALAALAQITATRNPKRRTAA
ncbi:MAG TPA: XdhC family protein [Azospirillaceae bacterium]|nr:XdhC family protein [Azospirillaceae bacterium]